MSSSHIIGTWREGISGETVAHHDLIARVARNRAVLLGETHDRYDIHRWQLAVCASLLAHRADIAVGFEMFPRRVQPVLDRWVAGNLSAVDFLGQAEWETVWRFDPALYMPLFDFCREFGLPMLALNCERPLVTRVGKEGWDAIPEDERAGLTPAIPASAAHRQHLFELTRSGTVGRGSGAVSADDPAFDRFVRAQQTWDRAFACNIAKALEAGKAGLVVGIIGRGHMEYGHGTPFQLAHLGIADTAVLLPSDAERFSPTTPPIADAVFRLPPLAPTASNTQKAPSND